MTLTSQRFACGSTEITLDLSATSENQKFIYVDDVLDALDISKAKRFVANGMIIPYLRDDHGNMYNPKRIPFRPGCVIQVICDTMPQSTILSEAVAVPNESISLLDSVNMLSIKSNDISNKNISQPQNSTLVRRTTTQLKSLQSAVLQANHSGHALNVSAMQDLIGKHLVPANNTDNTLQYLARNMDLLTQDVGELKQQGNVLEQLARKMIDMQQQALDRLSLIQSKTEAILTQQLEIAEYPIPRLFIVLPEEVTKYDPANWFRTKFRLHFICECGKHTEPADTRVRHHLHLAKHQGYVIREPTKFFKQYGPFLLLMLEMIKFGTGVAGHVVPTLASLKAVEFVDSIQQSVESVTAKIDYSLECIDKQLNKFQESTSATDGFVDTDVQSTMTQQDLANYLNNVQGLEGVELRQLESFLKTSEKGNVLGNLYRMTTSEGHVKWVCLDHYRAGYQEKQVQKLREAVKLSKGYFDEQLGMIAIDLTSSFTATEFYAAFSKARGVLELDVKLDWDFTKGDLEALKDALETSRVSVLRLDLRACRSGLNSRLFSTASQVGIIYRFQDLVSMKIVHIVLPVELFKIFSLPPKIPPRSCKFSLELILGKMRKNEFQFLIKGLSISPAPTTLTLRRNSQIGSDAVDELIQVLKTNSTLTTLNVKPGVNIYGLELFKVLAVNKTLTVLNVRGFAFSGEDVKYLSEALKSNSTIRTMSLTRGTIDDLQGAHALSEGLKTNSGVINLDLANNKIGGPGCLPLGEALKVNRSLTVLSLEYNSIGDGGAATLSMALAINSTLIYLNLRKTSIGQIGAQSLSKALQINSTLTTLILAQNSIGDEGARALSTSLKINTTLTSLNLSNNWINADGFQSFSEVLKTNSTLTSLGLGDNECRFKGIQFLSEALKINKTLVDLELFANIIVGDGIQVLSEALKINSTLTTLDLSLNSFGDRGAQALLEVLKINTSLTMLELEDTYISDSVVKDALLKAAGTRCSISFDR